MKTLFLDVINHTQLVRDQLYFRNAFAGLVTQNAKRTRIFRTP